MILRGLLTDRQPLVRELEKETGATASYSGAPSFRYYVGPYTVLRNGSVEVQDDAADVQMLSRLAGLGLIEEPENPPEGISFDASGFSGRTLTNIVNTLAARGDLISKATGKPDAFHMGEDFVKELRDTAPASFPEFMDILHACGGDAAMKGLRISGHTLIFTGLPENDDCRALAEHIVQTAARCRWIKPNAAPVVNQKYSFRVWLNTLGMKGKELAQTRDRFLARLEGDSSYRTPEQRAAFEKKRAKQRRITAQPDFVVL